MRALTPTTLPVVRRPGRAAGRSLPTPCSTLLKRWPGYAKAGEKRGLLATAFERLAKKGRPHPRRCPNQSAHELRRHYVRTPATISSRWRRKRDARRTSSTSGPWWWRRDWRS